MVMVKAGRSLESVPDKKPAYEQTPFLGLTIAVAPDALLFMPQLSLHSLQLKHDAMVVKMLYTRETLVGLLQAVIKPG